MVIDEGTLYPLLRRLESQGLLVSEWREEDKRNKRFYQLSAAGRKDAPTRTARRMANHQFFIRPDTRQFQGGRSTGSWHFQ